MESILSQPQGPDGPGRNPARQVADPFNSYEPDTPEAVAAYLASLAPADAVADSIIGRPDPGHNVISMWGHEFDLNSPGQMREARTLPAKRRYVSVITRDFCSKLTSADRVWLKAIKVRVEL